MAGEAVINDRRGRRPPGIAVVGTEPFRSRANSLPRANRPIGLADSLPGQLAPWPFHSLAILLPRTFAPWPFRSGRSTITTYCEKNSYKEMKVT